MKYIRKRPEPAELRTYKAAANNHWVPTYQDLPRATKHAIHQALLSEQGWICGYCEQRIDAANSHIEHLRPQSRYRAAQLDYENLIASCQRETAQGEPLHCGKHKHDWYDAELFISPLTPVCEQRFRYTAQGVISARQADDQSAQTTIKQLALDINKLRNMRAAALAPFLQQDDLTEAEFVKFVNDYLLPDSEGRYNPFWSTIQGVLGQPSSNQ